MPKTNQNFDLYKGDSRRILITLDANVPSLVGGSARWWVGKDPTATGADIYLKKACIITDNVLEVVVVDDDFDNLPVGRWYHETEITLDDGRTHTVTLGYVNIIPTMITDEI